MALFIRKYNEIFKLFGFVLLIFSSACSSESKTKLRIACAANLEYSMEEIATEFEKDCDCEVEIITASTGQLTNQIIQGAPYDVFISASLKYNDALRKEDVIEGKIAIFAKAKLILWSTTLSDIDENFLINGKFTNIAIPNPTTAPIGKVAEDYLKSQNYLNYLRGRIIYGSSVSQVNQMIASGNVDLGITTESALHNPNLKNKGSWHAISPFKHQKTYQTAVVVKNSQEKDLAIKFRDFLSEEKAQKIILLNGYDLPTKRELQ